MDDLKHALYNFGVDIAAFFMKLGLALTLPFKFVQFWLQSWQRRSNQKNTN